MVAEGVKKMKIDKKYIKMCEKAKEIQKIAPSPEEEGCFFYNPYLDEIMCRDGWNYCVVYDKNLDDGFSDGVYECETEDWHKDENIVWLPRQDQLQEMVKDDTKPLRAQYIYLLGDFVAWWKNEISEKYAIKFLTFEQMWLAFVMWKKYGKIWDEEKEEWVSLHEKNKGGK